MCLTLTFLLTPQVYGVAQCKISIGYEHESCSSIVWETQTCTLQGFDVDISDIGGWSLDVHHHYNFHEGTIHVLFLLIYI